jgi:hypothetical protein
VNNRIAQRLVANFGLQRHLLLRTRLWRRRRQRDFPGGKEANFGFIEPVFAL